MSKNKEKERNGNKLLVILKKKSNKYKSRILVPLWRTHGAKEEGVFGEKEKEEGGEGGVEEEEEEGG